MSDGHRPTETATIDQLCAQIDDIGRKANHLIDTIRDQRDTAVGTLRAIKDCLEYRDEESEIAVQVRAGQSEYFWSLLRALYRSAV